MLEETRGLKSIYSAYIFRFIKKDKFWDENMFECMCVCVVEDNTCYELNIQKISFLPHYFLRQIPWSMRNLFFKIKNIIWIISRNVNIYSNLSNLNIHNSYSYIKILLHLLLSFALKINWKMTFSFVFLRKFSFNYWKTMNVSIFLKEKSISKTNHWIFRLIRK